MRVGFLDNYVYKMMVDGWIYYELLVLKFGFFQTLLIGIR